MITSVPLPPTEGIGYYVWNLSRFLVGQGHQVQIITRGQRGRPFCEEVESIPLWRPRFLPTYPLHVHLHGLFVQRLVRRLEAEVDLFHLHTPLPPPIRSNRSLLLTAHTSMLAHRELFQTRDPQTLITRLQIPISIQVERAVCTRADKIVTVARSVANEISGHDLGEKHVTPLGNGVDTDVFFPGEQGQIQSREMYVLAAGRLDARKGLEDLIEAISHVVKHFPTVKLYIAGAGSLEERLRAKAEQLALNRTVRFLGHISERSKMVELYQGAVVFAHAAYYEGLPTVLLEAMACGRAVVSTAVSGALDVLSNGVNGVLVPPRAPETMAEAICRILGDTDLRARLEKAARHTVEERFSWQVVGSNYMRCYQALLNDHHQRGASRYD
jgi:glycosyltransferase involved in cell wall biosynthesis